MLLYCDICKKYFTANINKNTDIWSVFQEILIAHQSNSPNCKGDRYTIKIISV